MRDAPYLHAKHLDEAVRQQVITSEQREALDALARTMAPDGGPALPELAWFRWMLAVVVAAAVGVPGLAALAAVRAMYAGDALAAGLFALGVTAGGAVALRGRREHALVKNVLAAGAASFAWLVGAGAGLKVFGLVPEVPHSMGEGPLMSLEQSVDYNLPLWTVPGDLAALLVAALLGVSLRAPAVCLPAALALAHAVVRTGTWLHLTRPYQGGSMVEWGNAAQLPWWVGASALLVALARLLDRRFARGADPAFWVHLVAPSAALLGLVPCVERAPGSLAALAALLWSGSFALAFMWRRIAWAAWGALGLFLIAVARLRGYLPEAATSPLLTGVPLSVAVAVFAIVATSWRRHMLATAAAGDDARSPWG